MSSVCTTAAGAIARMVAVVALSTTLAASPARAQDEPTVTVVDLVKQKVLVKELTCAPAQLRGKIRKAVTDATNAARRHGLDIAGPPVVRYLERTPARFTVEAGVPIQGAAASTLNRRGLRLIELPAGKAATVTHIGPYEKLALTHAALDRWLAASKRKVRGKRWEVFVSNPVVVRDPGKRETRIFVSLE